MGTYARRPLDEQQSGNQIPTDYVKVALEALADAVDAGELDVPMQQGQTLFRSQLSGKARTET
jgi:hypothetical protein